MHLIWFIMIVISTFAPTGAAAVILMPVTALYKVISERVCRGGFTGRGVVASITADIHRSSVHSQMMMINIRRIIAANEMRFADESHSSKFKRKKWKQWGWRQRQEGKEKKHIDKKELSDSSHLSI